MKAQDTYRKLILEQTDLSGCDQVYLRCAPSAGFLKMLCSFGIFYVSIRSLDESCRLLSALVDRPAASVEVTAQNYLVFMYRGSTLSYSLICHKCNSLTGSCALNTTTECNRTIHHTCRSISVNEVFGAVHTHYILSGCGGCFGLHSFNSEFYSDYIHTTCCSSSLCSDDVKPEIENSTLNGLECHGCFTFTKAGCTSLLAKVKCKGQKDHCVHTSGLKRVVEITTYVMKDCVSDFVCLNPNALNLSALVPTIGFYCCKDNLCNLKSWNFTKTDPGNTTASNSGPTQLNASIGSALLPVFLKLVL
ncbi:uncharacterized protein [Scyliorhinus torazame]|uniref:uncharacterized protein n=1 Tax=Scyliorhinus torazame TaxID=75743 RepID=UPI003B596CA2